MKTLRCMVLMIGLFLLINQGVPGYAAAPLKLLTMEYPPYTYTENGDVKGFVTELIHEAFRRMDQPITIQVVPWTRGIKTVKDGDADGLFTVFKNPEREQFLDYSDVLVQETASLFVLQKSSIVFNGDLKQLSQYRFGVVRGFSYGKKFDSAVKNNIISNIDAAVTAEANVKKLLGIRFDIMVSDRYTMHYLLKDMGFQHAVKELSPAVEVSSAYLVFSKKRALKSVMEVFDMTLMMMKKDGTYNNIIATFFQ